MKNPHPNAALIKQLADDTSTPLWMWDNVLKQWSECLNPLFAVINAPHAVFILGGDRPTAPPRKTCVLAGIEFPMPETTPPAIGMRIYVPDPRDQNTPYYTWTWDGEESCVAMLSTGFVHLTKEAAEQHARALVAANKQAIEEAR